MVSHLRTVRFQCVVDTRNGELTDIRDFKKGRVVKPSQIPPGSDASAPEACKRPLVEDRWVDRLISDSRNPVVSFAQSES